MVYGPLANGATSVLFESVPTYPDPGRYWEMVERLNINQFYGAPTAIRLLLKYGDEFVTKYNRDSLKILGTGLLTLSLLLHFSIGIRFVSLIKAEIDRGKLVRQSLR